MAEHAIDREITDAGAAQPKKAWREPKLESLPIPDTETGGNGVPDGAGTYT